MYAAYGRLQAIGRDPYEITPAEVFRGQFDPVLRWTERPWQDTPSVYGPITSWTQLLANKLGGENMHDIVFWLQVFAVVPFIIACAGVVMLAHGDPRRQARATLLSIANPMLIWAVVAGAHNEALSVMFAVAGMLFMRKNPFLAGIGIGLAGCAKVSIGIWGLAMLWAYRREPKKAALLCLGTIIPMGWAYVIWQPTAFFQALRNGGYVSVGSWANPVFRFLDNFFMTGFHAKVVVGVIAYAGLFVIGWMLSRVVPWTAAPGLEKGADLRRDPLTIALRTALVLSVAWLITSMYTLSWYDLIAWMPLAVLAASKLDRIMLLRITAALSGLCAGPLDRRRAGAGFHRHSGAGHGVADHSDRRAGRRGDVVEEARPARALPVRPRGPVAPDERGPQRPAWQPRPHHDRVDASTRHPVGRQPGEQPRVTSDISRPRSWPITRQAQFRHHEICASSSGAYLRRPAGRRRFCTDDVQNRHSGPGGDVRPISASSADLVASEAKDARTARGPGRLRRARRGRAVGRRWRTRCSGRCRTSADRRC